MSDKIDLVQYIKDHPGCTFVIDNDCWWVENGYDEPVINEDSVVKRGSGYGSGGCYGGDILQALAEIVGVKIESV